MGSLTCSRVLGLHLFPPVLKNLRQDGHFELLAPPLHPVLHVASRDEREDGSNYIREMCSCQRRWGLYGQHENRHRADARNAAEEDAPDYMTILDEINEAMEMFGFQIKRFQDEYTGRAWIAFVNIKSDELAKVATEYGPQEISYFRTLVRASIACGVLKGILFPLNPFQCVRTD